MVLAAEISGFKRILCSSPAVPVNVHQPQENTESLLLVKVGAAVIEIRPGYNPVLLSDVVRTLQALC